VLGGETLKTLPGCSEEATWNTQAFWNTQAIRKKIKLGVPLVKLVRSLVVLMTIILAMVLLKKLR